MQLPDTPRSFPPSTDGISLRPGTECVMIDSNDQYNASSTPIYQSATFKQSSVTSPGEYDYSRSGNPTRSSIEKHLGRLLHANTTLVVNSGMTALDIITRIVKHGQEIVAGLDIYGGTNRLLNYLSVQNSITVHHVDTTNLDELRAHLNGNTRLILLETPTNPLLQVCNIPAIAQMAHAFPSALVVVDNTMMSPYLQLPLEMGADIVYHSGTKYLSGHHDLMAGVVGCKDESIGRVSICVT